MKVIKSKILGFCAGVNSAISIAENTLKENSGLKIYTLGPLLHNAPEVERLENLGIHAVNISDCTFNAGDVAIISAHGTSPSVIRDLEKRGAIIVNATCRTVEKVHKIVDDMTKRDMFIIIVGNPSHAEVLGLMGHAGENYVVIDPKNVDTIIPDTDKKLGVISQTTIDKDEFFKVVDKIKEKVIDIEVHDTVCPATSRRQNAGREIAANADITIVIGGKKSANTKALAVKCSEVCKSVHLVESINDLDEIKGHFKSDMVVAIVSGASTPKWLISQIEDKLLNI